MNDQIIKEKSKKELLNSKIFVLENEILKRKYENDLLRDKLSKIKKLDEIFLFVNEVYVCNPSSSLLALNDELLVYKEAYNKIIDSYKSLQCNILKYQRIIQEMKIEIHSLKLKLKEREPEKRVAPVNPEIDTNLDESGSEVIDYNEIMKSDFLGIRGVLNLNNKSSNSVIGTTKRSHSLNFITNDIINRDYNPEGASDPVTPIYQMISRQTVRNDGNCFETLNTLNLLPEDKQIIKDFLNKVNTKVLEKTKRITELERTIEQMQKKVDDQENEKDISSEQATTKVKSSKKIRYINNGQRDKWQNNGASNSDSSSNRGVENAIIDSVLNNISARKMPRNGSSMITINRVKINSLNQIQQRSDTPQRGCFNDKPEKRKTRQNNEGSGSLKKHQPSQFLEKLKEKNIKLNLSESANDSKLMNSQANCSSIKNRVMNRLNLKLKEK